MSQAQRPLFDSHACAEGSSALQQSPKLSEAMIAAPKPERQDNGVLRNAEGESNNASGGIAEEDMPQSEGLRQTSRRLPGKDAPIPDVTFKAIILGIMRKLFKEIEENDEEAHKFAVKCSLTLSLQDLRAIVRFQGQLGSPITFGGYPPYFVAKNMEISHRYVRYEDGLFDREGTEDAFRRLFQAVEKIAAEMDLEKLEKYANARLGEMGEDATARTSM